MPERCPSCGEKVIRLDGEARTLCTNGACPAQLLRNIEHFASKDAMNIDGLGPAISICLFIQIRLSIADLYTLDKEELIKLEKWGEICR